MKCNNCGFNNDPNIKKCIKCNEDLISGIGHDNFSPSYGNAKTFGGEQASDSSKNKSNDNLNNYDPGNNYVKTLLGEQAKESYIDRPLPNIISNENMDQVLINCPSCGYQAMSIAKYCPNCNTEIKVNKATTIPVSKISQNFKGTIDPFSRKGFSLRPVINGEPATTCLDFSGTTELNRENTIKDNMTITSKIQAEIKLENGEWFLIDKSQQKTTFLRADGLTKLKKGDIILLGDTKFIFE